MRKIIKKGVVVAMLGVTMAAQAATVTLNAGVPQTVQLTDATSGRGITVSLPRAGGSHLEFSNGTNVMGGIPYRPSAIVDLLNFLQAEYQGDATNTFTPIKVTYGSRIKTTVTGALFLDSGLQDLVIDQATGAVVSVGVRGGFKIDTGCIDGLWTGGVVSFSNLRFDFSRKMVVGDMSAAGSPYVCGEGPSYVWRNIDIFSFTLTSGSLMLPVSAFLSKDVVRIQNAGYQVNRGSSGGAVFDVTGPITLSNLRWTGQSISLFTNGLGLLERGTAADNLRTYSSGPEGVARVRINNRFTVTTP